MCVYFYFNRTNYYKLSGIFVKYFSNMASEDKNQKGSIDRSRTNILRSIEQPTLLFLCKLVPKSVSPDMLTGLGMVGTLIVFLAFYQSSVTHNRAFLLIAIIGFAVNWLGDSLDGRIAYFRNTPRKWYGFALDCVMDWLSLVFMGLGFYLYIDDSHKMYVFLFCCNYAWIILIAQLKYKITDKYSIDPGPVGPTEIRIILCLIVIAEYYFGTVLVVFSLVSNVLFLIINVVDMFKLLKAGNERDAAEKLLKDQNSSSNG